MTGPASDGNDDQGPAALVNPRRARGTPAGLPADRASVRSAALEGRDRVALSRPSWASASAAPGHRSLPLISAEALALARTPAIADRLAGLNRDRHVGRWTSHVAELRDRAGSVRRETLPHLEQYLAQLARNVELAGGAVHRAATPHDAVAIVTSIARAHGVQLAVKSKSMITEEIGLNRGLEDAGIEAVETDLGEYILQVADERPSHITAPALHKSRTEIAALLGELAGRQVPDAPPGLAQLARDRLRPDFRAAQLGISGVNFACADTGTLVLVTNEGNGRMVTSQPPVHIAVMSVDKVIARFADLATLLPLLSYTGAWQHLTTYQTLITGPAGADEADGPDELHLVILDNGRSQLVGTRYNDILACIRCGSCQIACPVYRNLGGGQAYPSTYGGPIGAVLSPLIGEHQDADLPFLSSLCGACREACPVSIDLPDMLVGLRADFQAGRHLARGQWWAWSVLWRWPAGFIATSAAAAIVQRLLPAALLRRLPGPRAWSRGRAVPSVERAGRVRARVASRARSDLSAGSGPVPVPLLPGPPPDVPACPAPAAELPEPVTTSPQDPAARLGFPGSGTASPEQWADRFAQRLADVAAHVHRCQSGAAARTVAQELCAGSRIAVDRHPDLAELALGGTVVQDVWDADIGVTGVLAAAAETGTLAMAAAPGCPRSTSLVPPIHIALVPYSRLVATYADLIGTLRNVSEMPSSIQLVTGPSRSSDIEMRPVIGVHGPGELHVILYPDS
ncbi:MAG TPA: LUD domain-containing protein [Streptosporangiaceae bacterium]|nr:LUD domain-containing protein [Streptosporangiaceae bacterium]